MIHQISVDGSDISFVAEEGETVLDAAERAGYALPYSCRKGVCSSCEGGLSAGKAQVRGQGRRQGPCDGVLLCQARAQTDLTIAPKWITTRSPLRRKFLQAKVRRIEWPSPDVAVIRARFPNGVRGLFEAGQYLRVVMSDGDSRNYSFANPPHRNDEVELHIRQVPGGKFSDTVLGDLATGSLLQVELPYGTFTLPPGGAGPVIMLATGTGFAPVKSIVEDRIARGDARPIHLYWGARSERDLYRLALAQDWANRHSWLSFTPVLSEPAADWTGRRGLVHRAVMEDHPDLSSVAVYACGAPAMVDAARAEFISRAGLSEGAFHSDAFVPTGDLAADECDS